jgi:hypothetical protein
VRVLIAALLITIGGFGETAMSAADAPSGQRGILVSSDVPRARVGAPVLLDTVGVDTTLAYRDLSGDNTGLDSIAAAVHVATRIEAWRLAWADTSEHGARVIGTEYDTWRAPDLVGEAQAELEALLRAASRSTAPCMHYRCCWTAPAYRLIIHDQSEKPLTMVVSRESMGWSVRRGNAHLSGFCRAVPEVAMKRLQTLLARVFYKNGVK